MGQYTEAMIPLVRQVIRDELAKILDTQERSRDGLRKALVSLFVAELDEQCAVSVASIGATAPPALTLPVVRPEPFAAHIVALFNDPPPELREAVAKLTDDELDRITMLVLKEQGVDSVEQLRERWGL